MGQFDNHSVGSAKQYGDGKQYGNAKQYGDGGQDMTSWEEKKLASVKEDSMNQPTGTMRESIWKPDELISFDDIMDDNFDEFFDDVDGLQDEQKKQVAGRKEFTAQHKASQAHEEQNHRKDVSLDNAAMATKSHFSIGREQLVKVQENDKSVVISRDELLSELRHIQQDFTFGKIDAFLQKYQDEAKGIPENNTVQVMSDASEKPKCQNNPIKSFQIDHLITKQPTRKIVPIEDHVPKEENLNPPYEFYFENESTTAIQMVEEDPQNLHISDPPQSANGDGDHEMQAYMRRVNNEAAQRSRS